MEGEDLVGEGPGRKGRARRRRDLPWRQDCLWSRAVTSTIGPFRTRLVCWFKAIPVDTRWASLCHSQGDALMQPSASVDRLGMS